MSQNWKRKKNTRKFTHRFALKSHKPVLRVKPTRGQNYYRICATVKSWVAEEGCENETDDISFYLTLVSLTHIAFFSIFPDPAIDRNSCIAEIGKKKSGFAFSIAWNAASMCWKLKVVEWAWACLVFASSPLLAYYYTLYRFDDYSCVSHTNARKHNGIKFTQHILSHTHIRL